MIRPMPAYFVVSIPRKEQAERKNKIGSVALHPSFVYMTRGMQCGQIVAIGEIAADYFPEARLGATLLIHHFVESSEKQNCIATDGYFNYYVVTCKSHNGQNNQAYGVFTGTRIVPHPDYIFLECAQPTEASLTPEQYVEERLQQRPSGLFVFKEWRIDREGISKKIQEIKAAVDQLTKSKMTEELARVINEMEAEMKRLSKKLNKQAFELFTVAAVNALFSEVVREHYGMGIAKGDPVYMLNIACETKMEFNKTQFIVAKTQHFGLPFALIKNQMLSKGSALLSS